MNPCSLFRAEIPFLMTLIDHVQYGRASDAVGDRLATWNLLPETDPPDLPHASKNPTLIARDADGGRHLVKLADGMGPLGVVHEGHVLAALAAMAAEGEAPLALPEVRAFDADAGVLALRWLTGGENLHYHHRRTQRYGRELGRLLGRGLGWLHAATHERLAEFPPTVAHPSSSVEPLLFLRPDRYARLSRAGMAFYAAVQEDSGAMKALMAMHHQEVTPCLVHGDLKQANLLRLPGRPPRVVFLDWELAHAGDPASDVGALIAGYLPGWLAPRSAGEAVGQAELVALFAALLGSYRHARGRAFPLERDFTLRVMRWAGASLLFNVVAITLIEGRFDERESRLTQYALDMLSNPYRWAWELLEVLP
jgi:aminoglycoside phosphotransferase (APT) family kinase protein